MVNGEKTTLEVIAPTIEEAVSRGLNDLGLPEEAVEVEVLDAGSRGFLGLGSRQARVRLIVKRLDRQVEPAAAARVQGDLSRGEPTAAESSQAEPEQGEQWQAEQLQPAKVANDGLAQIPAADSQLAPPRTRKIPAAQLVEEDRSLQVARETVGELLEKMKVKATVTARYAEVFDPKEERPIQVEIHGNDLSILIGRKSETLNALQYISSLIVGKELEKWVALQIDVEGYRARRERALRQLARRMADQAITSGRRQVLEPMPSNERRIIHLELRDHPRVMTESIGDEPNRKVTIILKKD